jgi:hypothetical protein
LDAGCPALRPALIRGRSDEPFVAGRLSNGRAMKSIRFLAAVRRKKQCGFLAALQR